MLRLSPTDPLAQSLFTPKELKGLKHVERRKRGKKAGEPTDRQALADELERRGFPDHVAEHRFAAGLGADWPRTLKGTDGTRERSRSPGWMFDFAWIEHKVALEFDGLVVRRMEGRCVVMGRHATITGIRDDNDKLNCAMALGWRVLRCDQEALRVGSIFLPLSMALGCSARLGEL